MSSIYVRAFVSAVLAATVGVPALSPSLYSAPPDLIAAYGFNEGSGVTAGDASGYSNTGTRSQKSWAPAGKFGMALSFSGTSSSVRIEDAPAFHLTNGMTLEPWVNPASASGWRTAILKESPTALAYSLYSRNSANRPAAVINTGGADVAATSSAAVALNVWTHLAATYDGSRLRLYVNGVENANLSSTGTLIPTASPLRIGGNAVWGEYFKGMIDEVRIYNRALSAVEIQTDMNTPVDGGPTISITAPASGASVAGSVAIAASAAAPAGVSVVQFMVDGGTVGAKVTEEPSSIIWDTTAVGDGSHVLTAALRDCASTTVNSQPGPIKIGVFSRQRFEPLAARQPPNQAFPHTRHRHG